jgi:hypothetical protein
MKRNDLNINPGPLKRFESKSNRISKTKYFFKNLLPFAILGLTFFIMVLNFKGIININGLLNPDSENYLNWKGIFNLKENNLYEKNVNIKCPLSSCETGNCCGSKLDGSITETTPMTSGVLTYEYCECPEDTIYSGVTDKITPGGPYKICTCNFK